MIHVTIGIEEVGGNVWKWQSTFSSELVDIIRTSKNPTILKDFFDMMAASAVVSAMNPELIPPGIQKELSII